MTSLSGCGRYGPGCERHKGDPHNLCQACWALEPDPATLSVTQGGIGDTAGFFLPPNQRRRDIIRAGASDVIRDLLIGVGFWLAFIVALSIVLGATSIVFSIFGWKH